MGKYHGIGGFRIGKVGNERYYLRNSSNVVAIAKPYKAINSQWIKQEEFKAYILSLLNVGVPQVYVLDALPEALFPYALLFIQNNNSTNIYLDKDGERTELHISGGGGGFEPTQPQLAAMNSGITTEKRESYDLSVIGVDDLKTRMLAAETGLGEVETTLETKADKESTYTKTDVNVMLDVKADKLTTYTKTEVDDAIDGLDTKLDRLDVSVDTKLELKLDRRTSTGLGVYCHNGSVQGELSVKTSVSPSPSDTSVLTEKAVKTYADSIKTDVNNKLDKRTTDGIWLYSHSNANQGEFHVLPVVEDVATDFDILTAKAVKTYVDNTVSGIITISEEYTTNINYNGVDKGDCKWRKITTKISNTIKRIEWIGYGYCDNPQIPITMAQSDGSYRSTVNLSIELPTAMLADEARRLSSTAYAPSCAFWIYQGGSARSIYFMRPASQTISGDLYINLYCSYIDTQ